jgi:hypothetical protein
MKIATFTIEGMHCDGCASTTSRLIERSLGDPHRARGKPPCQRMSQQGKDDERDSDCAGGQPIAYEG